MQKTKGFTLIELLIVVAIIAILAAIAVPNFLEAQVRAKVARVKSDQRTMATAIESYFVDHGSYLPNSNGPGGGDPAETDSFIILTVLSTPIAYMSNALLPDPFPSRYSIDGSGGDIYTYTSAESADTAAFAVIQDCLVDTLDDGADTGLGQALELAVTAQGYTSVLSQLSQQQADQLFSLGWVVYSQGPDRISRIQELVIEQGGDPGQATLTEGATAFVVGIYEWAQTAPPLYDPTNGTVSRGDIMRSGKGVFEPRHVGL
jgi:prepilin-type N-terminal cleavage/methylation domain-containing protein